MMQWRICWILLATAMALSGCMWRSATFNTAARLDQIELMSEAYAGEAAVLQKFPARLIDTQLRSIRQEGLRQEALTAGMAPVDAQPAFPVAPIKSQEINKRSFNGRTALHFACLGGNPNVVRALLESGAKVNALDAAGYAPLHVAAAGNHLEAAILLLEAGAKVNYRTRDGWSAVALASRCDNPEMVRLLQERGAKPNRKELWLDSSLAQKYDVAFLQRSKKRARNPLGESALELALLQSNHERVKELLAMNADPNHETTMKLRPLHYAAAVSTQSLQLLVDAGAEINKKNKADSPLQVAARNNHVEALNTLLCCGGDPNERGMSRTRVDIMLPDGEWHLLVGEFNQYGQGWTPLHTAAYYNRMECARLLLEAGAEPDSIAKNSLPQTPMECARINRSQECMQLLKEWSEHAD